MAIDSGRPFVVLKFGGSSVATAAGWQVVATRARQVLEDGAIPVLVCSALAGVSDLLETLLEAAHRGEHRPILTALRHQHLQLAATLGVDFTEPLEAHTGLLDRLALAAELAGESTPRMQARVMAVGELLSTQLGAKALQAGGLPIDWLDARQLLESESTATDKATYLEATFSDETDLALQARLATHEIVLTQGFIGRDTAGETVLLGRGGSDTTATTLAARIGALRCEIWSDVPGVFTADPREVPSARLLRRLHYDEAQEIASAGAKVLHPRCIGPCRRHGIPIHTRSSKRPGLPGTVIDGNPSAAAQVKVIAARRGIQLASMSTLGMWQQVGFLADVFGCFRAQGVSVDLVSTSEANVTASFDTLSGARCESLVGALAPHCRTQLIGPCAAVSLVGRNIRGILHELGPVLEAFESHRIHLIGQAASDLNLTFVVDEDAAPRLVARLHALLFDKRNTDAELGPSWSELSADSARQSKPATPPWWVSRQGELRAIAQQQTPTYVYDLERVHQAARRVATLEALGAAYYAIKANDHPQVLRTVAAAGLGLECVSVGELEVARACVPDARLLFTPNFAPRSAYEAGFQAGAHVTVDCLHPLQQWPELFRGRSVMLRIDPGKSRGHHAHVRTAGPQSKFGIAPDQIQHAVQAAKAAGVHIVGLHAHAGSGIRGSDSWQETALFLAKVARRFPEVTVLDLGGGLGVPYKPAQDALDLQAVDRALLAFRAAHPQFELWLEPGRYIVAEAGVLLATVTQTKLKGSTRYVGIDAGMHTLLRPALYGAWHNIVNLSRLDDEPAWQAHIVGPICETGDTLGHGRSLPVCHESDVMLIATAGAYGMTMSSTYNRQPAPREVVLERSTSE